MTTWLPARLALALLLATGTVGAFATQATDFRLADLGPGNVHAVGGGGDVMGSVVFPGRIHEQAARWHDGGVEPLSDLGFGSRAIAANGHGDAAGYVLDRHGAPWAVRWLKSGERVTLGLSGQAVGINRKLTTIGFTLDAGNAYHPWIVNAQGGSAELPSPVPGDMSVAWAINNTDLAVGQTWTASNVTQCVRWQHGVPAVMETPPGVALCAATAVNNAGHIAGTIVDATGNERAFLWIEGQWTILGTLGGATSRAVAVDMEDTVVGMSQDLPDHRRQHPFVWSAGVMTDLHAAFAQQKSVDLDDVAGIDEVGRISGTAHARRDPTRSHAYRLVPLYDK